MFHNVINHLKIVYVSFSHSNYPYLIWELNQLHILPLWEKTKLSSGSFSLYCQAVRFYSL